MLRRRALAGSRAVLADLCGPRAGARPHRRIPGSELQLIAGAARVPARGPGASSGAVLEWPARRPDIGVGPATAFGAAAKRPGLRDGMFRAGFSAVVAIRGGRDRVTSADDGSNL